MTELARLNAGLDGRGTGLTLALPLASPAGVDRRDDASTSVVPRRRATRWPGPSRPSPALRDPERPIVLGPRTVTTRVAPSPAITAPPRLLTWQPRDRTDLAPERVRRHLKISTSFGGAHMETTQQAGTQEHEAEPSLEASLRKFNEAFNRFDAKQVASCWAEDGTLISPAGEVGKGRSGVEAVFRHDCDTILAGTSSRFAIAAVRRLGNDLAFVDLDHELQNFKRPDGSTGSMALHVVMLAKRSGSGWQWLDARPYAFVPRPPSVH